jgi:hypothetical protein
MPVSVSTIAQDRLLTSIAHVKRELGLTGSTYDVILAGLVEHASSAIESYCNRIFARQVYSETLPGFGGVELQLGRAPLIAVSSVLEDGTAITDYSLGDRDESYLYREAGFGWTAQAMVGLSGRQRWPMFATPAPDRMQPDYTVAYTAGYLLPGQWTEGQTTISASDVDNSFNDSASGFPSLCKAGDVIEVAGFTAGGDNGRFLVTGTPTAAKIIVDATLTTEAASNSVTIKHLGHSDVRPFLDVEKAAIETVKAWHFVREVDASIVEKRAGSLHVRYSEQDEIKGLGIPPLAAGLLRPWVR